MVYIVVRGHEVQKDTPAAAGLLMPSGFVVPPQAKLQLQRIDNITFQPLEFAPLVSLPKGYAGLMYMVTFATATVPAGNSYVRLPHTRYHRKVRGRVGGRLVTVTPGLDSVALTLSC